MSSDIYTQHQYSSPTTVVALPTVGEAELAHRSMPMGSAWASRRQICHVKLRESVFRGKEMSSASREIRSLVLDEERTSDHCHIKQAVTSTFVEPEASHSAILPGALPEKDVFPSPSFAEIDEDALRAAYATRHNLVLDSIAPHLAPHIVITPPEDDSNDYYTQWINSIGPQWPTHLMVTTPHNAFDHTLLYTNASHYPREHDCSAVRAKKRVFRLSKFKTFIASLMRERVCMHNIVNALQRHHRKTAAFEAGEVARLFFIRNEYSCPSEKPFQWTDPAKPLLQPKNQYRGTIVLDSPSPFRVPHIVINEPPPQDPWVPWYNATNTPQDHGFGRYLVVPQRMVLYINGPDGIEDYWGSPFPSRQTSQSEHLDPHALLDDADYSGSSSSESEPGTPCSDSHMDDFLLDGNDRDLLSAEILRATDINMFDSFDDSPWNAIMNRYSCLGTNEIALDGDQAADLIQSELVTSKSYDAGDDDELPPFDDWYQSVATRAIAE